MTNNLNAVIFKLYDTSIQHNYIDKKDVMVKILERSNSNKTRSGNTATISCSKKWV